MIANAEENRIFSILFLIQISVILCGWMGTAIHLKFMGYPDTLQSYVWSSASVFVRNWGFVLFAIPAAWIVAVLVLDSHPASAVPRDWLVLSGYFLLIILIVFLMVTAFDVGHRPLVFLR